MNPRVTMTDDYIWTPTMFGGWRLHRHMVWQTQYGPIPAGWAECGIVVSNACIIDEATNTKSKRFRSNDEAKAFAMATVKLENI